MAKYRVKFEIEVIVDEPGINAGSDDEVVYDENGVQVISDDEWNEIVSDAVDQMEDIQNNVVEITREEDDEDDDEEDD